MLIFPRIRVIFFRRNLGSVAGVTQASPENEFPSAALRNSNGMGEEESVSLDQSSTERPRLNQAIILTSSLISTSHSITVFTAKWQSIRAKLEDLLSHLSSIEDCQPIENLSLSIAVESIFATLKNGEGLANRCLEFSYGGKLLMQSDLDMISVKLDVHVKNLSDIYSAGLLTQGYALVVSRPSVTASKDDIRFYVNDLLSRLKIDSIVMKKQSLASLNEVIQEDERYVKIALELDGFINILVNFLDLPEEGIQEEAAKAVSVIAGYHSSKSLLVGAGIIAPLVRIVESSGSSAQSKQFATRCLMKVTENSDNAWSVSAHGGVTALLTICENNSQCGCELVALACGVLKNLVAVEEIKSFMVEEGAISDIVELARSRDEVSQICSLDLLQTMAHRDESVQKIIIREGGIRVLVRILDPRSSFSTKSREVAFRAIANIFFSSGNSIDLLINYSFMDHILYFLRHGEVSIQELSLKAAFWLCGTSEEAKKVMGEAGFIPVLAKFLDSKSHEIREMALETLSDLLLVPKNQKRFVQDDENVAFLLQMLDPEGINSGNEKVLLSILKSLSSSSSARKKIVNSGYLRNIQILAEAEVPDAKKIVRKLSSSNRFRSILTGFW